MLVEKGQKLLAYGGKQRMFGRWRELAQKKRV